MGVTKLDLVKEAYRAFADRDVDALREASHPEIEVFAVTGLVAGSGQPYVGADGLATYIADVEEVWDEIELTPQQFDELSDGRFLVTGRVKVKRDRARVDAPNAWLWEFEGDLVRRVRILTDPAEIEALTHPPQAS